MTRIKFLNTMIDGYSMLETVDLINHKIKNEKKISHVVVNAAKIVDMQDDDELRQSVNECDLINPDGQAIVWASRFLGNPLKERVAGIDLMENLVRLADKEGYKIFFLGAKEDVLKKVIHHYSSLYNPKIIAGYRNGYFNREKEEDIAQEISESGAQLLFVAISSPYKENFLHRNKETLKNVNFTMGVGGSFDVVSGEISRAPIWMQKNGLEWFYRFLQEPKRMWKRYLVGNTKFILLVLKEKISKKQ